MSWNDADYFRARAEAERRLASSTSNRSAAKVHRELAERYDRLVRDGDRPTLLLVPTTRP